MEIRDHRLVGVRQCPSPNCDPRPDGTAIELVVVHGISLPPGRFGAEDVEALFCNRLDASCRPDYASLEGVRVSSHLLVHRTGACVQFVPFHLRAWHAGVSSWRGREGCNDFSVGIELEGTDEAAYTDAQYSVVGAVIRSLRSTYGAIAEDAVVGHADVAPGRKTDPGPAFDWARLGAAIA
ncbi:MAG: 1,6-anhydro-N-acetylmuramyl-L-alanine amidase AmpD [Pseudomonadales bacterium]|jgi:AmpD protein|nr:1,6-anhydro-N-acetylmuramyl-L-alanine amidase AmpD [Pseudomonadales bacterium]